MAVLAIGSGIMVGVAALVGIFAYGSLDAAIAALRSQSIVAPDYVDFGSVTSGQQIEKQVIIRNYSNQPVRLIGGTSDCSCVTTSVMPITIPSKESVVVQIQLKGPASVKGQFSRYSELWTDHDSQRIVRINLGCFIDHNQSNTE